MTYLRHHLARIACAVAVALLLAAIGAGLAMRRIAPKGDDLRLEEML